MSKTLDITAVRNFFADCPFLNQTAPWDVDKVGSAPTSYTIQDKGKTKTTGAFINVRRRWQHIYVVNSVYETDNNKQRIENIGANQDFQNWVIDCSDKGEFPAAPEGVRIMEMNATETLFLGFESGTSQAHYQSRVYIIYEEV